MTFKSLNRIIGTLQAQNGWQEPPFHRLLKCWPEAVGTVVASHTRPLSIQRDVLWVATSSAVWSQELTFGRQQLLTKLNTYLPIPLADIRFSTAQWQRPKDKGLDAGNEPQTDFWREHPSLVEMPRIPKLTETPNSQNPKAAFQHWARVMQARSHGLPLCPQCQCPTPVGELQRWDVCAICVTKKR
ncbi:MAG: DUF721 domain-containing protein [Chroococcidiopsidaceae cyanobacterium CP_BM_RX_35]|nr:DUF721 domain-containing protein [Chroococcidiopsidaceae cyanobacterium CP_BM_RX_35]